MKSGRKVCNELKAIRQSIADANGIEYTPNECTHEGECAGTCPACEQEVKYLENQLGMRRMLGKAVVVAGLSLSVASCASCGNSGPTVKGDVARTDTTEMLEGDVACPIDSPSVADCDSMSIKPDANAKQ